LTALLASLEVAPYLLVGLIAGTVADRLRTRPVAITTCLVSALASVSVPIAALAGVLTVPHLFVAALASGIAFVFFDGAMFAALPAIVPRDDLAQAYSSLTAVSTIIGLIAPVLAGFLSAAISPQRVLLLDAGLSLLAVAVFVIMREPVRTLVDSSTSLRENIVEGLRFIQGHRLIRTLTYLGLGNSISEGILYGLLVATVVTVYGLPDTGPHVGLAYSALAFGALIGARLLPRLKKRFEVRWVAVAGLLSGILGIALWSQQPSFIAGAVGLAIYEVGSTVVILNGITERARLTPDALQGRVNTTARMIAWGGQPLGALIGAGAVLLVGIPGTHVIALALLCVTAVLFMYTLRPSAMAEV
jgi:MFS family permease